RQDRIDEKPVRSVALVADDYVGMKPTMHVAEGDAVKVGQPLFNDKRNPGVKFTAPAAGKVAAIHRGEKRRFLSVVIEIDGDEQVPLPSFGDRELTGLGREAVRDHLL